MSPINVAALPLTELETFIRNRIECMMVSATIIRDEDGYITRYVINTGAIHQIIGAFVGRGHRCIVPAEQMDYKGDGSI